MDEYNPSMHGVLVLETTASVNQILERVVYRDAHLNIEGMKVWDILCPNTGEEVAFMFSRSSVDTTLVYTERPEDNMSIPDYIHPFEVVWMGLNGGSFPKMDGTKLYFWNDPEHEARATSIRFSAVNGEVADSAMVDAGRVWTLSLHRGDPATGLDVLHRLAHELRQGRILPAAIESEALNAITKMTNGDNDGHNVNFMML